MELKEIADALVAGIREGRERANLDALYASDAVSVEASDMGGQGREAVGLDAIKGKHEWWESANTMTGGTTEGPFLHGPDRFAVYFSMQGKDNKTGETFDAQEVGIYTVGNGKIVREEFFYTM